MTSATLRLPGPRDTGQVPSVAREIWRYKRNSLITLFLIFGIGGGWATFATISGAVISQGIAVLESNARSIQHLSGGVIQTILVREGQRVAMGDLLVRLDETQVRSQREIAYSQLLELKVRRARLEAERLGADTMSLPEEVADNATSGPLMRMIMLEKVVLDSRQRVAAGQEEQLRERIRQTEIDIEGTQTQVQARARQIELIGTELTGLEQLFARNLVPMQRVAALRREQARLVGERGMLVSEAAKSRARIAEIELQILQIGQQRRSEINQEARETAARLSEATDRLSALDDTLNRIEIRSPASGIVHQLAIFTNGGVVRPGETLMRIVPDDDPIVFEGRIQPRDIDQVRIGQPSSVRLLAANQPTTSNMEGVVTALSPDITFDSATQQRYFTVKVSVSQEAMSRAQIPRLVAGMPADLFIRTDDRTPLSYLLRPLLDQAARAFRER
jgi:HlyD family secretion protein